MTPTRRRKMVSVDIYMLEGSSVEVGRFSGQSRAIHVLYSAGLAACPTSIASTVSWSRIFIGEVGYVPRSPQIDHEEPRDNFGFSEGISADIDPTILDAPGAERPGLYLRWLHRTMTAVARRRGWDEEPLEFAARYCLERGVVAVFDGPSKSSPDRRRSASVRRVIDPDGYEDIVLRVQDRSKAVVAEEVLPRESVTNEMRADWGPMKKNLRWIDAHTIEIFGRNFEYPGFDYERDDLATLDLSTGVIPTLRIDVDSMPAPVESTAPALLLDVDLDTSDVEPAAVSSPLPLFNFTGGGPTQGEYARARGYSTRITALLGQMTFDPRWQAWWQAADLPRVDLSYWVHADATRIRVGRSARLINASIERPITDDWLDAQEQTAEADVRALIAELCRRFPLGAPPPLPA
ncbi:hypothetical protein GIS00_16345 [Nakamurella sp. YIM 132087]|uniref:Uncharacterized protein n=1 Tax=Nakamurella alba TaxID=2665158 RepID=A0A7K1FMW3_9ACTN|nr:hypothetical protein [Nakamurella alba]MTD15507.1 hypothetical protein [Nakamurella alba]